MKVLAGGICLILLLVVTGLSSSGCSHFADREDDKPDRDPFDGVYVPNYVLEKMEEQRKAGRWRQQY